MQNIYLIKQRNSVDCGIACIAMVTGVRYRKVINMCNEHNLPLPLSQRSLDTLIKKLGKVPVRTEHEIYGELLPDNVYIMALLPLHVTGSIGHFIVVDTRFAPYRIYDPASTKVVGYNKTRPRIWGGLVKIK